MAGSYEYHCSSVLFIVQKQMPNIGSLFLAMFAEVELLSVGLVFNTLKKRLFIIEMDFIISKQVKFIKEVNCPSCSICSYLARWDKLD